MKIALILIAWNEADTIQFTLDHYRKHVGVDKIFVFDNFSTDGTDEICRQYGCVVQTFGVRGKLDDLEYLKIKNYWYRNLRREFDWVIVCDADELLMITKDQLIEEDFIGTTILRTKGFNIYSELMPQKSFMEIETGFFDPSFNKQVCFDLHGIDKINYMPGAHMCLPTGAVQQSLGTYQLRHYRCVGGAQRMVDRHAAYHKRMSENNLKRGWGGHYMRSEQRIREEWSRNIEKTKNK